MMKGFRVVRDSAVLVDWDTKLQPVLSTPEAVYKLLKPFAVEEETELCWVLPLDHRQRLITAGPIVVSRGSASESILTPALAFRPAIAVFAPFVIVAHNHPGGTAVPTDGDRQVTQTLRKAGELLDVELLDHLIVAPRGFYSFTHKRGALAPKVDKFAHKKVRRR